MAFGASHFIGDGSVVDMLIEEGFQVERVHAFENIIWIYLSLVPFLAKNICST